MENVALAIEGVDAIEAQHGLARRLGRSARCDRWNARAGIDFLHAAIAPHLAGRARHQHFALVHHGDAVREPKHAVDIVFDDQHRNIRGYIPDQTRHALAFGGGEAGERLIEQQHLRLGAERDA